MATATVSSAEEETQSSKLSILLDNLTTCLSSASSSLPLADKNAGKSSTAVTIHPPADGISLLDTKSEVLLSYLHNLVFLILFQLRGISSSDAKDSGVDQDDVVKKLVELRVYLDRGVRPLESRLKYQIDKVVKAAEDAMRAQKTSSATKKPQKKKEDASSDEDASDGSDSDGQEAIDEMAYRPNISAFVKGAKPTERSSRDPKQPTPSDGIYRPPRIKPTALPTTDSRERDRDRDRRSKKSSVIDEFVSAEMSAAPIAEPSIGSTIQRGGRKVVSQQERVRAAERRDYEEMNFVRLPKDSKKERAKRGDRAAGGFGGEEFRLLSEGAERIGRLTRHGQRTGALDKSRKRRFTEDGPRGDGGGSSGVGTAFEKRRKKIEGWRK